MSDLPDTVENVDQLEELLSRPSPAVVDAVAGLDGPVALIGVGGKMGPSLARMVLRAAEAAGVSIDVIGVSSFSTPGLRERLEDWGVRTHPADLLAPGAVEGLPDASNILYMVGRKFGSTGAEWNTWATNVYAAGRVAERYAGARVVAFSTGNVYPFVPVESGGATEETPLDPVGEYAQTGLGRERMFDYASNEQGLRVLHYRLNYAVETRYGVLMDIAQRVWNDEPVDVTMGHVNVIWQGYANRVALQCLALADSPPAILNVTGIETLSVRELVTEFGALLDREPQFTGEEAPTALLNNATQCHERFGEPEVDVPMLMRWIAHWIRNDNPTLSKPTHFQTRTGKF